MAGRGATYDRHHLEQIRTIQEPQIQGFTLAEMACLSDRRPSRTELPTPETWARYRLENDVTVWV